MSTVRKPLSKEELRRAFGSEAGSRVPPIVSPAELADLLGMSVKTIYEWIARGRLDGSFRKARQTHIDLRDRAIEIIFNGKEWEHEQPN